MIRRDLRAARAHSRRALADDRGGARRARRSSPSATPTPSCGWSSWRASASCVGRDADNDLVLPWDVEVSRVHALLERLAGAWTVVDDDLSRNGTFVNGQRVRGRRRLNDRDVRARRGDRAALPRPGGGGRRDAAGLEPRGGGRRSRRASGASWSRCAGRCSTPSEPGATPPSNSELAESLGVSTEAVRSHLKTLFTALRGPRPAAEPQAGRARPARARLGRRRPARPDRRPLGAGGPRSAFIALQRNPCDSTPGRIRSRP